MPPLRHRFQRQQHPSRELRKSRRGWFRHREPEPARSPTICARPFSACAGHWAHGEQAVDLAEERLHMGLLQMSVKIGLAVPIFVEHKAAGVFCVDAEIIVDAARFGARRRDLIGQDAQQFCACFGLGYNGPDDGDVSRRLPRLLPGTRRLCRRLCPLDILANNDSCQLRREGFPASSTPVRRRLATFGLP